ncbi:MAG: sulfatase [Actinobacteria bacterium]|nr:sulfatase [Actinomycetota bacterium]
MSGTSPPPLRILWVDIDSLRPDHLGCYGYPRPTSPNIDALATEGIRFDGLYTSDSPCLPSRSALQTGLFGIHNGAVGHGGTAADPFSEGLRRGFRSPRAHGSLAAVLSRAGLWTTTISVFGQHHSALHWYAGFNEAIQDGYNTWSADGVGRHALDWLSRNADRDRWFLHVHVWDPHTPYTGTLEDAELLGDGRPDWVTEDILAGHRSQGGPHSAGEVLGFGGDAALFRGLPLLPESLESLDDIALILDGYDTGIRRADALVGRLMDALAAQGVADDTVVVVSSDHGENFGELGVWCDHHTADEYTHRIPGVVRWPGIAPGTADPGLHYQLDLFASLLELAGAEVPGHWDGESFASELQDGVGPSGRQELVLSAAAWTVQRSLRWEDRLYVRTRHDGYHGYPDEMLYDLSSDPHLQRDIAGDHVDEIAAARSRLEAWESSMLETTPGGRDPHDIVMEEGGPFHVWGELPDYLARLRATGRGPIADQVGRRHPGAAAGGGPERIRGF